VARGVCASTSQPIRATGLFGLRGRSAKTSPGKAAQGRGESGEETGKRRGKLRVRKELRKRSLSPRGGETGDEVTARVVGWGPQRLQSAGWESCQVVRTAAELKAVPSQRASRHHQAALVRRAQRVSVTAISKAVFGISFPRWL
jgi:hypothetical protein